MAVRTVFLSSTAKDLGAHREAVYRGISGLDGFTCVGMEDFGARDWNIDAFCRAKVTECDLFVGIVGHLHGSCPPNSEQSYTEREYDAAVSGGKPRLLFIAAENFPLPANLVESDDKRAKQNAFRLRVSGGHEALADFFTAPDDLARKVVTALGNWKPKPVRQRVATQPTPPRTSSRATLPPDYLLALRRHIRQVSFVAPPTSNVVDRPEIETVYVPVQVESATAGSVQRPERLSEESRRTNFRTVWEQWQPERDGPLVVLGGPGAGKTTLLKHIGLAALDAAEGVGAANADLVLPADSVPVYVRLAKLGDLSGNIAEFLARAAPQVDLVPAKVFQSALKDGRCVLLLDGLDEAAARRRTADLSRWVDRIHNTFPKARIVLGSRFVAYRADAVLRVSHLRLNLVSLGDAEIRAFLQRWYPALEKEPAEAARCAEELAHVLLSGERPELRSLAGTPLMLLIMALIHRTGKGLPDRRVDLYDLCVNVLLEHWNKENEKEYIPAASGRAVLAPLAFWMHQKPGRYTASGAELALVIGPELERTPQLPERDPIKFLESVRDLSGLFTGQSEDDFAFLHPTFQEYLAAEYVKTEPSGTRRPSQRTKRS